MSFPSREDEAVITKNLSPFAENFWHWLVSGFQIFFISGFVLALLATFRSGALFRVRPVAYQWLTSFLALLIGIAHWSILGALLESGSSVSTHQVVSCVVQGVAWILLSLTVFMKPRQVVLVVILRSWWSVNFMLGTLMAVYAAHAVVRHFIDSETIVALASWPVCCLLLTFSGKLDHSEDLSLLDPFLGPSTSTYDRRTYLVHCSTYEAAGWFSRLCFTWLNPLLALGNSRPLQETDIPTLGLEDKAETAYNQFIKVWNEEKLLHPYRNISICLALRKCYGKSLAWNGVYALLKCVMLSAGPLVMKVFIDYAEGKTYFRYEGYVLVGALLVSKLAESLAQRRWYFGSRRIGMHVRSALIGAIYRKELKLSSIGRKSHAGGEVVSYMAVDAYRIGEFPFWFHLLWSTPLQIALALIILFFSVGMATVAGVVVLVLTMAVNTPMANLQQKYQNDLMAAQDERLRATSEVLRHMKIVKLQAWEERFGCMIDKLRELEIKWLSAVQYRKTYSSLIFWLSPILVATATFAGCYLAGKPLTASNVFTALATFRIIQEPIRAVPDILAILVQ